MEGLLAGNGLALGDARKHSVYCLYFPNGKRYVGVESRKGRRIADHRAMVSLRKGEGQAQVVHLAIRKHGWASVKWRYLATGLTAAEAYALERTFIRLFRTQQTEWGYNRSAGGEYSGLGVTPSAETRAKMSAAKLARPKGGAAHLQAPEVRAKIVATRKANGNYGPPPAGFVNTEPNQTSFKAGHQTWNKGRPMSAESKARISASRRGKAVGNTNGFKRGQSPWNKGQAHSEETRQRVSAAKTGRIGLPAGPNGEMRYFRPEQFI